MPIAGDSATYQCVDGFELDGNDTRTCQSDEVRVGQNLCVRLLFSVSIPLKVLYVGMAQTCL